MTRALTIPGTQAPSRLLGTGILTGQLTAVSMAMYTRDFAAYVAYANEQQLDWTHVTTLKLWRNALTADTKMSPNTINRMVSAVKRLMREAAELEYVTHETAEAFDQVRGVQKKALKEHTKPNARTRIAAEDMRKLAEAPDTRTLVGLRDVALLHTLASSGLRASELASLTQAQIRKEKDGYLLSVRGKTEIEYEDAYLLRRTTLFKPDWTHAQESRSSLLTSSPRLMDVAIAVLPMTL